MKGGQFHKNRLTERSRAASDPTDFPDRDFAAPAAGRSRARPAVALAYILLPLIFVIWLAFFRQEIPSFPPEGYTLQWFAAILDQRKFVDGFSLSLQVGVLATLSAWRSACRPRSAWCAATSPGAGRWPTCCCCR